jgi:hypothetical protein
MSVLPASAPTHALFATHVSCGSATARAGARSLDAEIAGEPRPRAPARFKPLMPQSVRHDDAWRRAYGDVSARLSSLERDRLVQRQHA